MAEATALSPNATHILIVEDEEEMRLLIQDALVCRGHRVQGVGSISAARQAVRETRVELVVSDIKLCAPESGIDLLHELALRSPDIAMVMMTGSTSLQTAIECLRDGAFDYLVKPFTGEELIAVVSRAVQRRRKMLAERDRVEAQLRTLGKFPSENPNPVLRVGQDGVILYANAASLVLLDQFNCRLGGRVPGFLGQLITDAFGQGQRCDIEVEAAGRWFSFAVTPIHGADYVYLYGHDISPLKETERELIRVKDQAQQMALHDALTGLPNRTLLEDRLQQAIARSERNREKLAVVFLDLDNFKQINDTHGHRVGDQVLLAVADRLRELLRKTDTVARWGGDEMILVLPEMSDPQEALVVCQRLKSTVSKPFAQDQMSLPFTLSMGIAIYPDDAEAPETLLQQADMALYLAKARGRNEVVLFCDSEELRSFREKANLRALLSQALCAEKIQAHYQPVVSAATGQVVGVEALARWHEDPLGWIPPGHFIPLAETMGLMDQLGQRVLKTAMQQCNHWQKRGWTLSLSVNVSIRQVFQFDFLKELLELTARFGLKPGQLILEMTESQTLLGLASESRRLHELSESGFQLSIDDFGQGYSSFSSLHEMPVNELKIDKDFVRRLQTEKGRRIVQAIVDLARALGLETVAEGVESQEQAQLLKAIGVQRLQGYFFARPMPGPELLAWLGANPHWQW